MSFWPFGSNKRGVPKKSERAPESKQRNVVGITSRASEDNLRWLKDLLRKECSGLFEVKYFPVTNNNRYEWEGEVDMCSAIILYHSRHMGRVNITDIDGSLYDHELRYLHDRLGKEKVVVVLDDMIDIDEVKKQEILKSQPSLSRYSSHLFLFPEKNKQEFVFKNLRKLCRALSEAEEKTYQRAEVSSYQRSFTNSRPTGDSKPAIEYNKAQQWSPWSSSSLTYQIRIFSRSADINYTWLIDSLKEDHEIRSADIKAVYITNTYSMFSSELRECHFAILYHTKNQGRLNITDVADSLYNEELNDMSRCLGKENVIVVLDDLTSVTSEDKKRIEKNQPSIRSWSEDLFLFSEREKHTHNLKMIKDIIRGRLRDFHPQHTVQQKKPQTGPRKDKKSTPVIQESSVDDRKNNIKQDQMSQDDTKGPQPKRTKTQSKHDVTALPNATKVMSNCSEKESQGPKDDLKRRAIKESGIAIQDMETGDTEPSSSNDGEAEGCPSPTYQIKVFYWSEDSNHTWLIDSLKEDDRIRSADIKAVYVTNDDSMFSSQLKECNFAILYHTTHQEVRITDVPTKMLWILRNNNVTVVLDDLTHNLDTIKQIIKINLCDFQAKNSDQQRAFQMGPLRDETFFRRIAESSVDGEMSDITPSPMSEQDSSPSCHNESKERHSEKSKTQPMCTDNDLMEEYVSKAPISLLLKTIQRKWDELEKEKQEQQQDKTNRKANKEGRILDIEERERETQHTEQTSKESELPDRQEESEREMLKDKGMELERKTLDIESKAINREKTLEVEMVEDGDDSQAKPLMLRKAMYVEKGKQTQDIRTPEQEELSWKTYPQQEDNLQETSSSGHHNNPSVMEVQTGLQKAKLN